MAKNDAVWCIDIGQCSLKALRCRRGDESNRIQAEAFDYIAYPKILSQPGADPVALVQDALKKFLSNHSVRGDRVAISVPGQSGLARFIKLPPVESKKIPDIVKYEAKQQIPFDLDDVIWDYQRLGVATEEGGFALETEIGLFAMKRDQVVRSLEPFTQAGIEIDYIQLTPLSLYNYVVFDLIEDRMIPVEDYDPEAPPKSTAVLSIGTDSTDLVITNGFKVWQRSIPLGGNHFTKSLTKELKLTFSKAEQLKCNAAKTKDPKKLFKAMKPVFNDLTTELQRSFNFFTSANKNAKVKRIVALGNTMKMPGLRRYLSQTIGTDVVRADTFAKLTGPEVLSSKIFKEHHLAFGVCYGLAVQALGEGKSTIRTNLVPSEIVRDRMIRNKQPWVATMVGLVLLACTIGMATWSMALSTVAESKFKSAESQCKQVGSQSATLKGAEQEEKSAMEATTQIGQHLIGNVDNRIVWLEMMRAVNECLPRNPTKKNSETGQEEEVRPEVDQIDQREEINIASIECQQLADLLKWWEVASQWYQEPLSMTQKKQPTAEEGEEEDTESDYDDEEEEEVEGPSEAGWVIQLTGYHYHNPKKAGAVQGYQYVQDTLLKNLFEHKILLPTAEKNAVDDEGNAKTHELVSMQDLGISYPVLIAFKKPENEAIVDPASLNKTAGSGIQSRSPKQGRNGRSDNRGSASAAPKEETITVRRFDFIIQFAWKPTPPAARLAKKRAGEAEETSEE
jgi:type IV pilus assembly protein PilM